MAGVPGHAGGLHPAGQRRQPGQVGRGDEEHVATHGPTGTVGPDA